MLVHIWLHCNVEVEVFSEYGFYVLVMCWSLVPIYLLEFYCDKSIFFLVLQVRKTLESRLLVIHVLEFDSGFSDSSFSNFMNFFFWTEGDPNPISNETGVWKTTSYCSRQFNDTVRVKNKLFLCEMIMVEAVKVKPFILGAFLFISDYLIQLSHDQVHQIQGLSWCLTES
jgi:hypothetical protein